MARSSAALALALGLALALALLSPVSAQYIEVRRSRICLSSTIRAFADPLSQAARPVSFTASSVSVGPCVDGISRVDLIGFVAAQSNIFDVGVSLSVINATDCDVAHMFKIQDPKVGVQTIQGTTFRNLDNDLCVDVAGKSTPQALIASVPLFCSRELNPANIAVCVHWNANTADSGCRTVEDVRVALCVLRV